ncbi:MAG TPA: LuxR C-terminal-related transcriptional regulator [Nocardioides sp.]|nr:LuxR C-terminal-related transcriptional regulator [Nocardioides sp.]
MSPEQVSRSSAMWDRISRGELNAAATDAQLLLASLDAPADRAEAHAALGLVLQRVGRIAESRDRFARAVELTRHEPRLQASYVADEAGSRFLLGDLAGAASGAECARRLGDRHANRFAACEALNTLAAVALAEGRTATALRLTREGVRLQAAERESSGGAPMSHLYLGLALVELDRFAEADVAFTEGLTRATGAGAAGQLTWFHCMRGLARFLCGQWDAATADARAALEAADRTGTLIARPLARGVLGLVEAIRGNVAVAADLVAPHEGTLIAVGLPGEEWLAMARAAMADDAAAAYEALVEGWLHTRRTPYFLSWRALAPAVVHHAVRRGDRGLAAEVAADAETGARLAGDVPSARGAALRCRATMDADPEAALDAVEALRGSGRPFAFASACLEAGLLLHAAGHDDRSRAVLLESADAFHGLRATPFLAYAGQRMVHLSGDPAAVAARPALAPGWELLTPAERDVAVLVAKGMSNPQIGAALFVSPRTVQTHTSHIYAKLRISSRVQLSALLHQHGLD